MPTTLEKKLRLPWTFNGTGSCILAGKGFTAVVAPILSAEARATVSWKTQVTVAMDGASIGLFVEYPGCLGEYGMRLVECYLFDRAIGIPHAAKEMRRMAKAKRDAAKRKTAPKGNR